MKPSDKIEDVVKKMSFKVGPEMDRDLWAETLKAQNEFHKMMLTPSQHNIWRIIMKSPVTKIAVAAIFVIACLAGVLVFNRTSGIALADVLDKFEQIKAYSCRMSAVFSNKDIEDMPVSESTMLISQAYGSKMNIEINHPLTGESSAMRIYILPNQGTITTLMPDEKKYSQVHYDKETAERSRQGMDPREMLEQILDCEHISLGRSTIDGIECEGFQTTDPSYAGGSLGRAVIRIWVDVETKLPVRMEVNKGDEKTGFVHIALTDFEWNVPFDEADFEPVIPDDYTTGQPMLQMLPPAK